MEGQNLINEDGLIFKKKKKSILTSYRCFQIQNIIIMIILFLQIFIMSYLIILGKYAQELNLFDFNKTETQEYITKFKIIIDNVCQTFVNCSHK